MHVSDDLYLGAAQTLIAGVDSVGNPGGIGVGPMGRVYVYDIVPITLDADGICAAQAVAGAGNANINGALASAGQAVLDVSRALQMVSSGAGDTTQTVTVYGKDVYGAVMVEARALNGTTPVNFLKSFKTVTRVAVSAALAGNLTLGTRDAFGLPFRVTDAGYIVRAGWDNALADNAGTFVAAVTTDPATAATGDVRGTFLPSSAANGTRRLVLAVALPALASGPNATRTGALGVVQFSG